jgi:hypothetical protein
MDRVMRMLWLPSEEAVTSAAVREFGVKVQAAGI